MKKTKTRKAPIRSVKLSKTKRAPAKKTRARTTRSKSKKKGLLIRLGLKTEYEYKKLHIGVALIFIAGLVAGLLIGINHLVEAAGSGNPYACADPKPQLQVGSTGDCVKRIQWYVVNKASHTSVAINGVFNDGTTGTSTKQAVIDFQAFLGLPATGVVNTATWNTFNVFEGAAVDPSTQLPGTIQGLRVDANGKPVTWGTVTVDGVSKANNPYSFTGEAHGRHWASAEAVAGWKVVGYSACINAINCHATITPGSTAPIDVPGNGYVDLWWHYAPAAGATATTPVAAPGFTVANNIKDHTCLVAGTSTPKPCTLDEYNQQTAFLNAVVAATTCVRADLTKYTCTASDHDKQAALFKSLTTCLDPKPGNPSATKTCTVEEHQKQAVYLQAVADGQAAQAAAKAAVAKGVINARSDTGPPPPCNVACAAKAFKEAGFMDPPACDEACAAKNFEAANYAIYSGYYGKSKIPVHNYRTNSGAF